MKQHHNRIKRSILPALISVLITAVLLSGVQKTILNTSELFPQWIMS